MVDQLNWLTQKKISLTEARSVGILFSVNFYLDEKETTILHRNTNESYTLTTEYSDKTKVLRVNISANNYFGARHGLETLFQLMEYDDVGRNYIAMASVKIRDYPEFKHRGITLDTSRNFIEKDVIKRIIDGMAHSKVGNVIHMNMQHFLPRTYCCCSSMFSTGTLSTLTVSQ
jgi:N-acetyl-beta-hexosaminidase